MSSLWRVTKVANKNKKYKHRSYLWRTKNPKPEVEGHWEQALCIDPPLRNDKEMSTLPWEGIRDRVSHDAFYLHFSDVLKPIWSKLSFTIHLSVSTWPLAFPIVLVRPWILQAVSKPVKNVIIVFQQWVTAEFAPYPYSQVLHLE